MLNMMLFLIQIYHTSSTSGLVKQYKQVFSALFLVLISILLVRYNIINSIHNFVDSDNNQYVYYAVVVVFVSVVFLLLCVGVFFTNAFLLLTKTVLFFFVFLFIYNIYVLYFTKIKHTIYIALVYSVLLFLTKKYNTKPRGLFYLTILQNVFIVNMFI